MKENSQFKEPHALFSMLLSAPLASVPNFGGDHLHVVGEIRTLKVSDGSLPIPGADKRLHDNRFG